MNDIQKKAKCSKCNVDLETTELKDSNNICLSCKKKQKQKRNRQLVVLAGLFCVSLAGVLLFGNKYNKIKSFEVTGLISDSISIEVQDVSSFSLNNLTATNSSVKEVSGTIDNITSFKRAISEEIENVKESNSTSLSIPSIVVKFNLNASNISLDGMDLLQEFEDYYSQTNKEAIIQIEGYTCNLGTDIINNSLSKARAEAVYSSLINDGVPAKQLDMKWYGKTKNQMFDFPSIEEYRRVVISIK